MSKLYKTITKEDAEALNIDKYKNKFKQYFIATYGSKSYMEVALSLLMNKELKDERNEIIKSICSQLDEKEKIELIEGWIQLLGSSMLYIKQETGIKGEVWHKIGVDYYCVIIISVELDKNGDDIRENSQDFINKVSVPQAWIDVLIDNNGLIVSKGCLDKMIYIIPTIENGGIWDKDTWEEKRVDYVKRYEKKYMSQYEKKNQKVLKKERFDNNTMMSTLITSCAKEKNEKIRDIKINLINRIMKNVEYLKKEDRLIKTIVGIVLNYYPMDMLGIMDKNEQKKLDKNIQLFLSDSVPELTFKNIKKKEKEGFLEYEVDINKFLRNNLQRILKVGLLDSDVIKDWLNKICNISENCVGVEIEKQDDYRFKVKVNRVFIESGNRILEEIMITLVNGGDTKYLGNKIEKITLELEIVDSDKKVKKIKF